MATQSPPQIFDTARHARFRSRAVQRWAEYDFLKARVSSQMAERLADTAHNFKAGLDLGCHTGELARALLETGKVAEIQGAEVSPAMAVAAKARGLDVTVWDGETLPFEERQFDLVASALLLHWVNDLPGSLIQVNRALKPDGLFLGAYFGAGTLAELRESLMQAETELMDGAAPRVSPLPGLQDSAALLQRAGFALPVADVETITVRYDTMFHLIEDLRGMGEQAAFATGGRPLSRRVLARAAEIYASQFADDDGRIRASFVITWLSGWAPAPNQPKPKRPGSARASLAEAVGSIEKSAGEKAGE
ncbi:MAG: methyltransferase domain-containing protein [Pseudomonadota bacterium]